MPPSVTSECRAAVVAQFEADRAEALALPAVPELAFNLTTPHLLPPLPAADYQCSLSTLVPADGVEALTVNSRNVGRVLVTTVIGKPFTFPVATASPEVLVADAHGFACRAHLCGLSCARDPVTLEKTLPLGSAIVFVHPFYREQTDKVRVLRVERSGEVRVVLDSQHPLLSRAITISVDQGRAWAVELWDTAISAAEAHKREGNAFFAASEYESAVNAYRNGVLTLLEDLPTPQPASQNLPWRLPCAGDKHILPTMTSRVSTACRLVATLLCNASTASFKRGRARESLSLAHASLFCHQCDPISTDDMQTARMKARLRRVAALLDVYRLDEAHVQLADLEALATNGAGNAAHARDCVALRGEWTHKCREMSSARNLAQWFLSSRSWPRERSFVHPGLRPATAFSSEGTPSPSVWHAVNPIQAGEVLVMERVFSCRRPAEAPESLTALLDHVEAHADALLPQFLPIPVIDEASCGGERNVGCSHEPTAAVSAACDRKTRLACWMHISDDMIRRIGWSLAHCAETVPEPGTSTGGALVHALGPLTASLPHDCAPNTHLLVKGSMAILVAVRTIDPGERVTRSLCPTFLPRVLRRARLAKPRGLMCACDRCTNRGIWAHGEREAEVSELCCPLCGAPTQTSCDSSAGDGDDVLLRCSVPTCAWPGEVREAALSAFHEAMVALDDDDVSTTATSTLHVEKRVPVGSWLRAMLWCRLGRRAARDTDAAAYAAYVARLGQQFNAYPPPSELRCFVVDMICHAVIAFRQQRKLNDEEHALLGAFGLSRALIEACFDAADGKIEAVYAALS